MFHKDYQNLFSGLLGDLKFNNLYKQELALTKAQSMWVKLSNGDHVLNLCSNNYLGLANDPDLISEATSALKKWGLGLASVRFICGTQMIHKQLEQAISHFINCDDALLFSSCYDANAGLFESFLTNEDAVFSDELNHACIIDGIRLCKASVYRYKHMDLNMLEDSLKKAQNARIRLIVTDGVFSMDGHQAPLKLLIDLANRYKALLMVDDSHGIGVLGSNGKGSAEAQQVLGNIDIITGTFGKALGGASGGFVASHLPIINYLRQKSRPYLFSNSLAPSLAACALYAISKLQSSTILIDKLHCNIKQLKSGLLSLGYHIDNQCQAILPIFCSNTKQALAFSKALYDKKILAPSFSYPVVPLNKPRIRLQVSAGLSKNDIDFALDVFACLKPKFF